MSSPGVTLSGKIRDISGNAIAGTVTATLGNYGGNAPTISADSEIAPIQVTATANGSGVWSMTLWGSDQISPTNTIYCISITPANSNVAIWTEEYLITSGSYDLSNLVPLIVTPTIYVQPLVGPTGATGPGSVFTTVSKSADFTATIANFHLVTTGSSTINATLPTAVGITGQTLIIKKVDSGSGLVNIATTGGQTIDGGSTYQLVNQWQMVWVTSDGSNWQITSNN